VRNSLALSAATHRNNDVHWHDSALNKRDRAATKGQQPCVLWFTGLSGAGKSTIANVVEHKLHQMGFHTYLLDGDNVRHGLNNDLRFSDKDRIENIRRVAEVAKLMTDAGLIVIVSLISPFRSSRKMARDLFGPQEFMEIFVDTPLEVAQQRDPKGLYKKAAEKKLNHFTGIDSSYEAPVNPEVHLDTLAFMPDEAADCVIDALFHRPRLKCVGAAS